MVYLILIYAFWAKGSRWRFVPKPQHGLFVPLYAGTRGVGWFRITGRIVESSTRRITEVASLSVLLFVGDDANNHNLLQEGHPFIMRFQQLQHEHEDWTGEGPNFYWPGFARSATFLPG